MDSVTEVKSKRGRLIAGRRGSHPSMSSPPDYRERQDVEIGVVVAMAEAEKKVKSGSCRMGF